MTGYKLEILIVHITAFIVRFLKEWIELYCTVHETF